MATHSRILAWRIPWTEEPGGLQSMGVTKSWTLTLSPPHFIATCTACLNLRCLLPGSSTEASCLGHRQGSLKGVSRHTDFRIPRPAIPAPRSGTRPGNLNNPPRCSCSWRPRATLRALALKPGGWGGGRAGRDLASRVQTGKQERGGPWQTAGR